MKTTFKVEGFRELDEGLGELPKATAKNVMRRTLIAAGEPLAADYASRVTVKSGQLRDGIAASAKLSKRQARLNRKVESRSYVEAYVGAGPVPEAHLEEFGSQNNAPTGDLRAAWAAGQGAVLDAVRDGMGAEIKTAADRLARKAARLMAKNRG